LKGSLKIGVIFKKSGKLNGNVRSWNRSNIFRHFNVFRKVVWGDLNPGMVKSIFIILFFSLNLSASAPGSVSHIIATPAPYNPFKPLLYATGMVETKGNVMAFNQFENAVGIFQIRQVRVDDYNRRTGNKYKLSDMFDYSVSEKVFLFFASDFGPYHFEKIAKAWNGSGPMTESYWRRIQKYLK
jgi:hypothetical protein